MGRLGALREEPMKGMGARGWPGLIGDRAACREGSGSRSGNPTLPFPHHSWLEMTYKNLRLSHFRKSLRIGPHLNSEGLTTPESEPTFMTQITPIFGAEYLVSKTQASGIPSQAKSLSCPGQATHSWGRVHCSPLWRLSCICVLGPFLPPGKSKIFMKDKWILMSRSLAGLGPHIYNGDGHSGPGPWPGPAGRAGSQERREGEPGRVGGGADWRRCVLHPGPPVTGLPALAHAWA